MPLFLQGLALGFSVAAPVGPIGLLCIRRSLTQSSLHGLLTGLGAATADALYGLIAGLGLASVAAFLTGAQTSLRLGGAAVLLYLSWKTATGVVRASGETAPREPLLKTYLSALALTVTNPATILSFAAAFAGLGLGQGMNGGATPAFFLVSGVFLGSAAWWLLLSTGTGLFRKKLSERAMRAVNYVSAALLAGFAVVAVVSIF